MAWLTARFETMKRINIHIATTDRAVRAIAEMQLTQVCLLIWIPLIPKTSDGDIQNHCKIKISNFGLVLPRAY